VRPPSGTFGILSGIALCALAWSAPSPVSGQTTDVDALLSRALVLHQSGDLEGAAAAYELVLRSMPGATRVRSNLGAVYARLGRYDDAIEQYRKALVGEEGGDAELQIRQNLTIALYKAGRLEEAATEAEALHRAQPANRNMLLLLCDIDLRLGKQDTVVDLLTPLAAESADDKAVAYLLGTALLAKNEVAAAQRIIDRVFRDDSPEGHVLFASLYMKRGDCVNALAELERARAGNPDLPLVNYLTGACLMRDNNWAGAEAAYRRELAIDPNHFESNLFLGDLLRQEGKYDEALTCIERAARIRGNDIAVKYTRGALYLALNRLEEAEVLLREVAAAMPSYLPTHRSLAILYSRLDRKEDALRERSLAAKLAKEQEDHAFVGAREALKELLDQPPAPETPPPAPKP
jgi:tetratricopeptide (TPR) repeat protein